MTKSTPKKLAYRPRKGVFERDGATVGCLNKRGYVVLRYEGRLVYAHRLAFFMKTGRWPHMIDHRNGVRHDNRWSNLREVDAHQNCINKAVARTLPGAHFHKPSGRYKSAIVVRGKSVHLGYFCSAEAASRAYISAKRKHHAGVRYA